ncbi:MAG: UDP binding domain-containing protein, partial [Bacteroidales bacterium]
DGCDTAEDAVKEAKKILGDKIDYYKDMYEALIDSDALVVVTEWPEFRVPNYKVMEKLMNNKVIFDGRNIYELQEMQEFGYTYYSIGRKTVKK